MINVYKLKQFFYISPPWTLLLSLFGVDGYFFYAIPNYYIIGEWFLGAIILMYILYPILLNGINKRPIKTSIIVLTLFLWVCFCNVFQIMEFRNIFSCMISFYTGMLLFKYKNFLDNIIVAIASTMISMVLCFVRIPFERYNVLIHIMGFTTFITLYWIGKCMKGVHVKRCIAKLGKLSYPIFLVHHVIVIKILSYNNPTDVVGYLCVSVVAVIITVFVALALQVLTNYLLRTNTYKDFENFILRDRKSNE